MVTSIYGLHNFFFPEYFKVPESNPFVAKIHIQKQPLSFILSQLEKKNTKWKKWNIKEHIQRNHLRPIELPNLCTNHCILHSASGGRHWPTSRRGGVPGASTASISNSVSTGNEPKFSQLKLRLLLKIKPVKEFDEQQSIRHLSERIIGKESIRSRRVQKEVSKFPLIVSWICICSNSVFIGLY